MKPSKTHNEAEQCFGLCVILSEICQRKGRNSQVNGYQEIPKTALSARLNLRWRRSQAGRTRLLVLIGILLLALAALIFTLQRDSTQLALAPQPEGIKKAKSEFYEEGDHSIEPSGGQKTTAFIEFGLSEEDRLDQEALDIEPSHYFQFPTDYNGFSGTGRDIGTPLSLDEIQRRVRSSIDQAQQETVGPQDRPTSQPGSELPTSEDEGFFSADELQELERAGAEVDYLGQADRMLPGVVTRGERASNPAPLPQGDAPTESPTPEEEPEGLPRVTGQARGYVMLYLMHPRARATVQRQVQSLLDSEINEVYLGVLTDGTFGKDFSFFAQVVRTLNQGGRVVTLVVYLTNGSTMRRFNDTSIVAGFNTIDPEIFRDLIVSDAAIRNRFAEMAAEVRPVLELNLALNPFNQNIVVVMLEDNLDARAYAAMREIARSELGDLVEFVRNPCPGCYPGNDDNSLGGSVEVHSAPLLAIANLGDGFSLDGSGYRFSGESGELSFPPAQVQALLGQSLQRGIRYFGLWRAERQGLSPNGDGQRLHPDERRYEVPSDAQLKIETELLRSGLAVLNQDVGTPPVEQPVEPQ